MLPTILSMVVVLALIVWRSVLSGLRIGAWARASDPPQEQRGYVLGYGQQLLGRPGLAAIDHRAASGSERVDRIAREERAEAYLRRIVALTGATKIDGAYGLRVGKVQFQVRDRNVRRLKDFRDPKSAYEETCFYPVHNGMPKAEEIATALLQLSKNPALFDKWALQNGLAFKPDGRVFARAR